MAAPKRKMSLKDFHGGSIPQELPLPSAPGKLGEVARIPLGPASSLFGADPGRFGPSTFQRSFSADRKGVDYYPDVAKIGRNYEEDERKPVAGAPWKSATEQQSEGFRLEERLTGYSGRQEDDALRRSIEIEPRPAPVPHTGNQQANGWKANAPVDIQPAFRTSNPQSIREGPVGNSYGPSRQVDSRSELLAGRPQMAQLSSSYPPEAVSSETFSSPRSFENHYRGPQVPASSTGDWNRGGYPKGDPYGRDIRASASQSTPALAPQLSGSGPASPPRLEERPRLKLLPRSKPVEQNQQEDEKLPSDDAVAGAMGVVQKAEEDAPFQERPKLQLLSRKGAAEGPVDEAAEQARPRGFGSAMPRELIMKQRGADDGAYAGLDSPSSTAPDRSGSGEASHWESFKVESPSRPPVKSPYPRSDSWRDPQRQPITRTDSYGRQETTPRGGHPGRGFERQGSANGTPNGHYGEGHPRGGHYQPTPSRAEQTDNWRRPAEEPAPVITSALVDTQALVKSSAEKLPTSLQLAEAFSRSTSLGRQESLPKPPEPRTDGNWRSSSLGRAAPAPESSYSRLVAEGKPGRGARGALEERPSNGFGRGPVVLQGYGRGLAAEGRGQRDWDDERGGLRADGRSAF